MDENPAVQDAQMPVFRRFSVDESGNTYGPGPGTTSLVAWGLSAFILSGVASVTYLSTAKTAEPQQAEFVVQPQIEPIDSRITSSVPEQTGENDAKPEPVSAPVERAAGYGAEIARGNSVRTLISAYSVFQATDPSLFEELKALINFDDSAETLQARLVVGPFAGLENVAEFCRSLQERDGKICQSAPFSGEKLPASVK